jgi:asparagine synthase (glutamine-hydrolysing)
MCGIAGILRFDGRNANVHDVERMRDALKHRGPDGEGLWHTNVAGASVAFGHTRLSIIDLSETGKQPMVSADGNYCITYNGEIFNYTELRTELKALGHRFEGHSDTEVLLTAFGQWGERCLSRLNGMFALAIWDAKRRALFCARDRLGIKPFFYSYTNEVFYFASEIKALLRIDQVHTSPDETTVYDYLSLGLMHHDERSFFSGIRHLPAGCSLWVESSALSLQRYWELSASDLGRGALDVGELEHLLEDAISLCLRSDVPVGILLSGGLDSSAITSLAARHYPGRLQAFSLIYDDPTSDESNYASLVAAHAGVDLRLLKPEGQGLWKELDDLITAQDGPTHAPEVYANWCMMRTMSKCNMKVLLTGQGGDELFGGYNWYPRYLLASLLRQGRIIRLLSELWCLPKNFPNTNTSSRLFLLASLLQAKLPINVKIIQKPELQCIDAILRADLRQAMRPRDTTNMRLLDPSGLEEKSHYDLLYCNVPQFLHYEDSNAMAFGIEERVPLLDHRLVEWAHSLMVQWKIRNGVSKYPLRQVMKGLLPMPIVTRKDKMGLSAPRDLWLREVLRPEIEATFAGECRIYEDWVDRKVFLAHLDAYMQGRPTSLVRLLWRCINLEKWLSLYA